MLQRWTARHEEWAEDVGCVAVADGRRVLAELLAGAAAALPD